MKIKLFNLTFNIESSNLNDEEYMGDFSIDWPIQFLLNTIKKYTELRLINTNARNHVSEWQLLEDYDLESYINRNEEIISIYSADDNIYLIAAALESNEEITLRVDTTEPFWLIHDICHARYDVEVYEEATGYEMEFINGDENEFERLKDAMKIYMPSMSLLKQIDKEFLERYKWSPLLVDLYQPPQQLIEIK